jgi:hypothetical protein
MGNTYPICQADLLLEENGKKVCLTLRANEEAKALVLDGCVFMDNLTKCDAMYLFKGHNKKVVALVELKGAGDIAHAFEQLAYTRKQRPEYLDLKQRLDQAGPGQTSEKAFIVSNGMLSKPQSERLESQHRIRISAVLYSEPSSRVPDLREWF